MSLIGGGGIGGGNNSNNSNNDKGVFGTSADLIAAYPIGQAGWFAFISETDTVWYWDPTESAWIDTGSGIGTAIWGQITGTLSNQTDLQNTLNVKANLVSPTFTGTPIAPTPTTGDNSTKIATTAFINNAIVNMPLESSKIFVGNVSNVATPTTLNGDATITNTGAITIADNVITNTKLAQATTNTWKGNNTSSTDNVTDNVTGSLSESTSSVLTITGGSNALLNATTIQMKQATTSQSGYLSNADWNTFNDKQDIITTPTANDFVYVDGSGQVIDSGLSFSTTSTTNTNTAILSSAATQTAISTQGLNTMKIQGTWNANTNNPTLNAGTGTIGFAYYVGTAGTQTAPSGISISYNIGDLVFYTNTAIWSRLEANNAVNSVFGRTGTITSQTGDYAIGQITNGLSNVLSSTNILVGNGSSIATPVAMSGDVAISNTGSTTIQSGSVTGTKIANTTITNSNIANSTITGSQIASNIALAGSPTTTTATTGDNSTKIATTEFVDIAIANSVTPLPNNEIFVGNVSNIATAVPLSGDAVIINSGAMTINPGVVTGTKIANTTITNANIATNTITNTNLSQASANTWKGNNTGSTANENDNTSASLTEITSSILTISGATNALLNPATIQVAQSNTSTSGYLSNTDWNTFNNKQSTLTNPITGTGTSGQVAQFNGTTTITGISEGTAFNKDFETNTANIKMDGAVSVGSSGNAVQSDHIHPTDTSRAPLNSPTFTGTVTVPAPINATDAATKDYVDQNIAAITQFSVDYTTTTDLNAVYNNGSSGVGATLTAISVGIFTTDGFTPALNSIILVKNQTVTSQNGIYQVTNTGSISVSFILTRTANYDSPSEITNGDIVFVTNYTSNTYVSYIQTAIVSTIGVSPILYSTINLAPGALIASNNLSDVANTTTALANLNGVINTTTVNGHALSGNVIVSASDITTGTLPNAQLNTTITSNTSGSATSVSGTNVVTNTNLTQASANTLKGNNTGSTANVADLTVPQITTLISSTTPTGNTIGAWDVNSNFSANNFIEGFTINTTSGSETDLTIFSTRQQLFQGSTSQLVVMPDATTLTIGISYNIYNISIGNINVYAMGGASPLAIITTQCNAIITLRNNNSSVGLWVVDFNSTIPIRHANSKWDINTNLSANNILESITSIVTSGTTTILTAASTGIQNFTGTTTQIIRLPDATNLVAGFSYLIQNESTGIITVQDGSSTVIGTIEAGTDTSITLIISGTTAGTWHIGVVASSGISSTLAAGNIIVGNASNVATATVMSGDATINNSGALTIGSGAITGSKIANSTITGTQISNNIALPGSPTTTTQTQSDNSTKIATTAYTDTGLATKVNTSTTVNSHALTGNIVISASDITTGTLPAAQLPNPTSTTLGGIESITPTTSQWIDSISTSGVPNKTQPSFTDISGTAAITQGGTGQITANASLNALLPSQTGNNGYALKTNGTNTSWQALNIGTVTSVAVVTANGLAGTVANDTTTPAISLSTTITGMLKGNGTAISAGVSGTDYSTGTASLTTGILKSTTSTGALTIAIAPDFPTLNQNTTGTSASVSGTNVITNTNLAQIGANTIKGNNTGSTANASDLSVTQVTAMLNAFTGDSGSGGVKGLVPLPPSGSYSAGYYLSAGGTWTLPTVAAPSYLKVTRTTGQTTSLIATNTIVQLNTTEYTRGSNITFNSSTYTVTLAAGYVYEIMASICNLVTNSNTPQASYFIQNVTTSAPIGQGGMCASSSATTADGEGGIAHAVIDLTSGSSTQIQLMVQKWAFNGAIPLSIGQTTTNIYDFTTVSLSQPYMIIKQI